MKSFKEWLELNEIENLGVKALSVILAPFAGAVAGTGHALRRGSKEISKGAWNAGWEAAKEFLKGAWETLKGDPKKLVHGVRQAFKKGASEFGSGVWKAAKATQEIPKGIARWTIGWPSGDYGWEKVPFQPTESAGLQNLIKNAQKATQNYVQSLGTNTEEKAGLTLEYNLEKVLNHEIVSNSLAPSAHSLRRCKNRHQK